jgi:hypothetical protein
MEGVASCFYGRVCDLVLEGLIGKVRKSKKLMDDRDARASDGCQEEGKKHTHGETLRKALLTEQRQERLLEGSIKGVKIGENRNKIQGIRRVPRQPW